MRTNRLSVLFVALVGLSLAASPSAAQPRATRPVAPAPRAIPPAAVKVELSADETAILAAVEDGSFEGVSFAEAALIASGVSDPAKRKLYLAKIDALEASARRAAAGAKTPLQKGEKLFAFLHAKGGPLKRFQTHQTSLAVLLDTGNFNCASSALLYNVLGRRLGLDVRAVELIGGSHVFSIVYDDATSADVETTCSKGGFNPERKKDEPATKPDRRRETGEAGLAAMIFANRAADLSKSGQYPEAVRAGLCAKALDPDLKGAANNAQVALARWCLALADAGRVEGAVTALAENRDALSRPGERVHLTNAIYDSQGQKLVKARDYAAAARLYVAGLRRHADDVDVAKHLRSQAVACFHLAAKPAVKGEDWAKAVEVYREAAQALPGETSVRDMLDHCAKKLQAKADDLPR
jgi:tetratricopeptide (TPR) repeat protein